MTATSTSSDVRVAPVKRGRVRVRVPWEITREKVDAVIERIVKIARPLKIFLFGSYVRGRVNASSDLDVLVVVRDSVRDPLHESVRVRRALRDILMPMDIIVAPLAQWNELRDQSGYIFSEVARTGRVVYEAPK
jgi:uncharacterized protein